MLETLFNRRSEPAASFPVTRFMRLFSDRAHGLEHGAVEPALVRARLADGYRSAGVAPARPAHFDALTRRLDASGWRRLALSVAAMDDAGFTAALPDLLGEATVESQIEQVFVGVAESRSLLEVGLIRQSALRTEEFARAFLALAGAGIQGESAAESRARLERIDYARLVAQAEAAQASAEERMAYLRKLQQEHEDRFARRGKW